ncbi:phosphatidyl serine synthase-domain-containing protein [Jimgerdemannia flammicorona]|uniref:Phosphatidyl serine synthase-domain-containing protein n=1 Tax=Jimgerdemannia flammicorona TaxID=994334 RepID=A0A433DJY2_9FUNG|nr:phosphatidyl serine synthase-domain-containing protein [Jimgerdemannia flammicorona]
MARTVQHSSLDALSDPEDDPLSVEEDRSRVANQRPNEDPTLDFFREHWKEAQPCSALDRQMTEALTNFYSNLDFAFRHKVHPRTLTALGLMLGTLVYVAFSPVVDDTVVNVKVGIGAAILAFILIGTLQFRDGPFIRPHVALWRAVLSLSVLYQMGLVFLLFQNKQDARHMFSYIDPSLGVPLPERSYADNCDLTWDVMKVRIDFRDVT